MAAAPETNAFHDLTVEETLGRLATSRAGLPEAEAAVRRRRWGPNRLPEPRGKTLAGVFVAQFKSPFIYLLLAAGAGAGTTMQASSSATRPSANTPSPLTPGGQCCVRRTVPTDATPRARPPVIATSTRTALRRAVADSHDVPASAPTLDWMVASCRASPYGVSPAPRTCG
ncbi:MAG: hypothetical protein FJX56_06165 [Alphaproteobacteria bacterium]|nr:hypothetical protein [Alphaproteobacteria bacterium]